MKILIFGGTTEGRELSAALAKAGADVTVSVASGYGAEEQDKGFGIRIEEGPKTEDEMRLLIKDADICVDATHPYAVVVSETIRKAAHAEGIEPVRLKREQAETEEQVLSAEDSEDAARIAAEKGGRVLLTTGSKDLQTYAEAIDPELLFPRVLPLHGSIGSCERAGIPHRNIIAVQGPFSEDFNRAVIDEYDIDLLVTKESGKAGGFAEKIRACKSRGIPAIVIARPADDGLSYEDVLGLCMKRINGEIET